MRSVARDHGSLDKIKEIQRLEKLIKSGKPYSGKNPLPFKLNLENNHIWLRESDAWVAMVLYTEIFKEKDHTALPGFDGMGSKYILDLGANIGLYSLKIKGNNPDCRIICVEPDPAMFDLLVKNIKSNDVRNVSLVNLAVAGSEGKIELGTIPECGGITGKYLGKIKLDSRSWIDPVRIKSISVETVSLSQLIKKYQFPYVDLIKMDVEGMELDVLRGASPILSKVDKIVLEWHEEDSKVELINFLQDKGFNLLYEEPRAYGNIYFKRKL